ncbi:MFS transporter [Jiangella sp. DSM 45060]|uniref:MFS transporter n=1 Tax=Jiangella sp. DSM 45060 TaxID=1798224 RepID=UPI00087A5BD8|nr:MFS transporter [Jiangella sp. DSM 45060]SDT62136.1 Predicted arabinose efflux permease, MFS family [Jiangella sp. DSM 45060]
MDGRTSERRTGDLRLAAGIVALEFAAAVSTFVASTLLPIVAAELGARDRLGLLIAGGTLGLFVAMPLAGTVLRRLGAGRTLALGTAFYAGGLVVAATAQQAWAFALGQFASGVASGLLAVFGISAAIRRLDERLRLKVVAASSAMWILPAMVGPAATLALEHAAGWRWTLVAPVPVVLAGRFLVVRAVRGETSPDDGQRLRPAGLLVPAGAAAVVLADGVWPVAVAGALAAVAGAVALLPAGTAWLRRGAPSALAAMVLFGAGYVGADSLITVLLTDDYGVGLARAAIVLGAAPLMWGLTSLVVARVGPERQVPAAGLALTAAAAAVLAAGPREFAVALIAWAAGGAGVGLAYPGLYLRATTAAATPGRALPAAELATAVITGEAVGGLLGRAGGGALASSSTSAAYGAFAVLLAAAALAATRSRAPGPAPRPGPGPGPGPTLTPGAAP